MAAIPFERFPFLLRQSAVSALGWRNRLRRFGSEYRLWSDLLEEGRTWDLARREQWQAGRVVSLVRSAQSGCPHYQQSLAGWVGDCPGNVLADLLSAIPLLEKQSIREHPASFRNGNVRESAETSTSGSTGSPMTVGHDAKSIQRRFALLVDHMRMAGVQPLDRSVRLSGRILCPVGQVQRSPWLYNRAERQLFLSSYHIDEVHQARLASRLVQFAPALLDGYPSAILEVLRLLRRAGARLESLRAVITTAETLMPDVRGEIEALSGVRVLDYYAASEGVPFIQQCGHGAYHVRWESGVFEVFEDGKVSLEGNGELVVTSFVQDRSPLIRYRTGDLVRGLKRDAGRACPCGRGGPMVDEVLGRVEDLIYTRDGRSLGMFTYRTLKLIPGLGETQVIQTDYDEFEVNSVVMSGDVASVSAQVQKSFERALGYPIRLKFNPVDRLPKGPNGKLRLVISRVENRSCM